MNIQLSGVTVYEYSILSAWGLPPSQPAALAFPIRQDFAPVAAFGGKTFNEVPPTIGSYADWVINVCLPVPAAYVIVLGVPTTIDVPVTE